MNFLGLKTFLQKILFRQNPSVSASIEVLQTVGQQQLELMAETVPYLLWSIGADGVVTYFNRRCKEYFALKEKEPTGWRWDDVIHPDEVKAAIELRNKCLQSGEVYQIEVRIRSLQDGKYRWFLTRSVPIRNAKGEIEKWIGTATDIHDQKEALRELLALKQRTDTVLQNAPVVLWAADKNGILNFYEGKAQKQVGSTAEDRIGKSVYDLRGFKPDIKDFVDQALKGENVVAEVQTKELRWFQSYFSPLYDAKKEICGVVGLSVDITDEKNQKQIKLDLLIQKQAGMAIAKSEARLRAILNTTLEAIINVDQQGLILDWNPRAAIMFGGTNAEAAGNSLFELFVNVPETEMNQLLSPDPSGKPQRLREIKVRNIQGEIFDAQLSVARLDLEGDPVYTAFISDITERKFSETKLINKQAQLSEAQEISHLGNWEWDCQTDRVYWSSELYRIHGLMPNEFEPNYKLIREYVHPEDRLIFDKHVEKCLAQKLPYSIDYRIVRDDGSVRMLVGSGKVVCDKDGKVIKLFGVCQDITERKKTTDALKALIDASPLSIIVLSTDGIVEAWNPAAEKVFGWSEAEVVGGPLPYVTEENRVESKHIMGKVVRGEPALNHELERKKRDGSKITINLSAVPLLNPRGEAYGVLAILTDITAKKASELELIRARELADQGAKAKSEFLAMMSHEIRTPINGVIGMTGLLLDTDLNTEQKSYAEIVRTSADNLLNIINDILDFSKIEAGKLHLEMIDFELRSVVHDIEQMLGFSAKEKGIRLSTSIHKDLEKGIFQCDPGRIKQILINLTSNAIKFTPQGSVSIRINPYRTFKNQVTLKFEITDTGIGIAKSALGKMFQAFSQADSTTTRKFGGTGLGLSISKQLVQMLGGQIGSKALRVWAQPFGL